MDRLYKTYGRLLAETDFRAIWLLMADGFSR